MPTAIEIFRRLIDDPDYQAKNGKTREEVVWEEAKQRERQHRNNNAALSLAWTDTPTLKSFIEYLYKADEEEVVEEIPEKIFVGPLEAIREAIRSHMGVLDDENNLDKSLPWSGSRRIGTLASLITPHVEALRTILDKSEDIPLLSPESPQYELRTRLNKSIRKTEDEDTSGEFYADVLLAMLDEYSKREMDMRAIGNEINDGRRLLQIGRTDVTQEDIDFARLIEQTPQQKREQVLFMWYNQLNSDDLAGRLSVLNDIIAYLPSFDALPPQNEQLNLLSGDQKTQGMYGNRAIGAKIDDLEDSLNSAAVEQFLAQTGYQLPSNSSFDHTRTDKEALSPETEAALETDFDNFMRLTFWNPDTDRGTSNLWNILQNITKKEASEDHTDGYYKLPFELVPHLNDLNENARNELLQDLINHPDPIRLLNPDNVGNSGLNSWITDYSNIEKDLHDSLIRGKHAEYGFNIIQNPDLIARQRPIHQLLTPGATKSPLKTLMEDLGVIIDPAEMDMDAIHKAIDERVHKDNPKGTYTNHFPFGSISPFQEVVERSDGSQTVYPAGRPLPDITPPGEETQDHHSRDFIKRNPEAQEARRIANDNHALHQVQIDRIPNMTYDELIEIGFNDSQGRRAKIDELQEEKRIEEGPLRQDYNAKQVDLANRIKELTDISDARLTEEERTVPTRNLEEKEAAYNEALGEYNRQLRTAAQQYLEDQAIQDEFFPPAYFPEDLDEAVEELLADKAFVNQTGLIKPTAPSKTEIIPPRPLTEEETETLKDLREEQKEPMETTPRAEEIEKEILRVSKSLRTAMKTFRTKHQNKLRADQNDQWEEDIQVVREKVMDDFVTTRRQDLKDVIAISAAQGITPTAAAESLGIPLNAREKTFLNRVTPQPVIKNGTISGGIVAEMKGIRLPTGIDSPSLNMSFDGGKSSAEIKAIVNNHPTFQELQALIKSLGVEFNLLDSSGDSEHSSEHRFNLSSPERINRTLVPFILKDGEPEVHPFEGPLEQNEDGSWSYSGSLFPDLEEMLSFMNETDLSRVLAAASDLSSDAIRGEKEDPVLIDDTTSVKDLESYYYKEEPKQVQRQVEQLDEEGNVVIDQSEGANYGKPLMKPAYDNEGNPIMEPELDDAGNPVMERTPLWQDFSVPEYKGGRIPHYELEDGRRIPQILPRQVSPAWKALRVEEDEDGNKKTVWEFLGKEHDPTKRSEYGLGKEAAKRPEAQYDFLKNLSQVVKDTETSPDKLSKRRHAELKKIRDARKRRLENESGKIETRSGLPESELDKFVTLMHGYHAEALNHKEDVNAYDFRVPKALESYIRENLEIFNAGYSPHDQKHLDAFLTNFYRQFKKRWNEEYLQVYNDVKSNPSIQGGIGNEVGLTQRVSQAVDAARQANAALPDKNPDGTKNEDKQPTGLDKDGKPSTNLPQWLIRVRDIAERRLIEDFAKGRFQEIRNVEGRRIIDELLAEQTGRRAGEERSLGSRPPVPYGSTHIPITIQGVLKDELIPTIPFKLQFPISRFERLKGKRRGQIAQDNFSEGYTEANPTNPDGEDIPLQVPLMWLWFRDNEENLMAMANEAGYSLEFMLEQMMDEFGRISSGKAKQWLRDNGFQYEPQDEKQMVGSYKGSTIPDQLIPSDMSHVGKARSSMGAKDLYRVGLAGVGKDQDNLKIRVRGDAGIPEYRDVEGESIKEQLQNVCKTPEMQELLQRLYGKPQDVTDDMLAGIVNPEGDVRGTSERELYEFVLPSTPAISKDENGNLYWDFSGPDLESSKPNEEGKHVPKPQEEPDITQMYVRLKNFIDNFSIKYIDVTRDEEGVETGAEGQVESFTVNDVEGVGRTYINPDVQDIDENIDDHWWRDEAHSFAFLNDMYDLVTQLGEVHTQLRIPLPHMLTRATGQVIIDNTSLPNTLRNFESYPLDRDSENPTAMVMDLKEYFPEDYFEGQNDIDGLRPPTSAKDLALQVSALRKYLKENPVESRGKDIETLEDLKERERAIQLYLRDLEHASEQFSIPDLDFLNQIQLESNGKEFALKNRYTNEDGEFLPFDENGNVIDKFNDFISPLMKRRRMEGQEDYMTLSDTMLDNATVIDPIPESEREVIIQPRVLSILQTIDKWGKERAKDGEDNPVPNIFKNSEKTEVNYPAIRALFGQYLETTPDGKDRLLMGTPRRTPEENMPGHPQFKPGILLWIHDRWDRDFIHPSNKFKKPSFVPTDDAYWGSGQKVEDHINKNTESIIEGREKIVDLREREGDSPTQASPDEVPEWDKGSYEEILDQIREGATDPDILDDMLHRKDIDGKFESWKFHLDEKELQQLREALTEGGHDNVEETVQSYDGGNNYTPPPEPVQEQDLSNTIPNMETNTEQDKLQSTIPNIGDTPPPDTGTQMDMFNNEEETT